ncbi:hypothetical protein PR048_003989 [Dryococelus australis]|uniref:Uncharacterized protein n=1 Tax=Dryococelus australis TaxID=614101 RepID=A0ABQ9I471_9NEOP|nr:hypothetical protein PR048_003989 [Dryococelus australis]
MLWARMSSAIGRQLFRHAPKTLLAYSKASKAERSTPVNRSRRNTSKNILFCRGQWAVARVQMNLLSPVSQVNYRTSRTLFQKDTSLLDAIQGYSGPVFRTLIPPARPPARSIPGFSQVRIVLDDAVDRRVFSGISRFPAPSSRRCSQSPSSTLKTSLLRAAQISSQLTTARRPITRSHLNGDLDESIHAKYVTIALFLPTRSILSSQIPLSLSLSPVSHKGVANIRDMVATQSVRSCATPRNAWFTVNVIISCLRTVRLHVHSLLLQSRYLTRQWSRDIWAAKRAMEQSRNARAVKTGDPRVNPPISGILRYDSHVRKSGNGSTLNLIRFALIGCARLCLVSDWIPLAAEFSYWPSCRQASRFTRLRLRRTTRLSPRRTGFESRRVGSRIFARWNRAMRCRCRRGFLGDLPPLAVSLKWCSMLTFIGSLHLDLFTHADRRVPLLHMYRRVRLQFCIATCSVTSTVARTRLVSVLSREGRLKREHLEKTRLSKARCPARYPLARNPGESAESRTQLGGDDTYKTPYDRVKRCRGRKISIKASERVNADVFTQNKRPCPQHSHTKCIFILESLCFDNFNHSHYRPIKHADSAEEVLNVCTRREDARRDAKEGDLKANGLYITTAAGNPGRTHNGGLRTWSLCPCSARPGDVDIRASRPYTRDAACSVTVALDPEARDRALRAMLTYEPAPLHERRCLLCTVTVALDPEARDRA